MIHQRKLLWIYLAVLLLWFLVCALLEIQANDGVNYFGWFLLFAPVPVLVYLIVCLVKDVKNKNMQNKKRALSYFLIYELILLISTIGVIICEHGTMSTDLIVFSVLLTIIPLGIYWPIRLHRESKQEINNLNKIN